MESQDAFNAGYNDFISYKEFSPSKDYSIDLWKKYSAGWTKGTYEEFGALMTAQMTARGW